MSPPRRRVRVPRRLHRIHERHRTSKPPALRSRAPGAKLGRSTPGPTEQLPRDLAEAYRLQAAVIGAIGPVAGWKVAAVTAAQRTSLAVDRPIGAAIPLPRVHDARNAPARLRIADFIAPRLECEIAFELGGDLPPRPGRAYSRDEVRAAIAALRVAVEIVDWRIPRGLGALAELADGFNNGALVAGAARSDWDAVEFARVEIVLVREHGGTTRRGRARQRAGDPRRRSVRDGRHARQRAT